MGLRNVFFTSKHVVFPADSPIGGWNWGVQIAESQMLWPTLNIATQGQGTCSSHIRFQPLLAKKHFRKEYKLTILEECLWSCLASGWQYEEAKLIDFLECLVDGFSTFYHLFQPFPVTHVDFGSFFQSGWKTTETSVQQNPRAIPKSQGVSSFSWRIVLICVYNNI